MEHSEGSRREAEIGLEVFYTSTPGTGGRLKKAPEDFVVEEISDYPEESPDGPLTIARVTSQNWETNRLIRQLAKSLRISRSKIGFAGTKDKRAITTQLMSFQAPMEDVIALHIHQVTIRDAYRSRREINIGDLVGNSFCITVRDCQLKGGELRESIEQTERGLNDLGGFPNFFGVQRFGALRPITHIVGKHLVHGDFQQAVMAYVGNPTEAESEESRSVREALEKSRDFQEAITTYPKKLTFERMVIGHLVRYPDDYVGAIKTLPENLQMMFVHAYQSYLFNRILSERIRRELPLNQPLVGDILLPADRLGLPNHDRHIPVTHSNLDMAIKQVSDGKAFVSGVLYGSESGFSGGEMGELERKVVEAEGLQPQDFLIPQIPQVSSKGTRRELICKYKDLKVEMAGEDSVSYSFSLWKGCYATSFLREFLKSDILDY